MEEDARFCPACGAKMIPESSVPKMEEDTSRGAETNGSNNGFSGTQSQGSSGTYGSYSSSGAGGYSGTGQSFNGSGGYPGGGQNSGGYGSPGNGGYPGGGPGSAGGYGSSGSGGYPGGKKGTPGLYSGASGGNYGGAMPPGNSGGGGSKVPIILAAVAAAVIIAIIGIVVVRKFINTPGEVVETTAEIPETVTETTTSVKESSGGSTQPETTAAAKGDLSKIKIPKGAEVKTDAGLWDLVGEYKGEIRMTRMDGYEEMDDITEEAKKAMLKTLEGPIDCELEIEEDGQWCISWPIMDSSMDFRSNDYDDPRDFTQEEIDAMLITRVDDGVYHAKIEKEGETDDGSMGSMNLHHIGAYCTDGSDKLIAGNFYASIDVYGMDVTIEGDFVVNKTTEDISKGELEVKKDSSDSKKKDHDEEDDSDFKGHVDTDVLGKKADELAKKQDKEKETEAETKVEIPTVSGGKWKQVGSEWMYEKDKKLVKNSWILHKNVYYYVDENGFMLTEAYTPDGYYVGKDGSWDKNDPRNKKSSGNSDTSDMSEAELREIAEDLSTKDNAHALEFDWFYDYVLNKGRENGRVITDKKLARRITSEQAALNGGWKAFMFTKDGDYGSDGERYFNATVDTKGGKFNITLNWKYFLDPTSGKTVTETGNDLFRGTYDDLEGTAVCRSDYAMIEFDEFYISTDGQTEYAIGTFHWISGEIDQIALVRGAI